VSYYDGPLFADSIDQADNISTQVKNVVRPDSLWPISLTIASLIRSHDVMPCFR
jgi:hypothetical protein